MSALLFILALIYYRFKPMVILQLGYRVGVKDVHLFY